MFNKEIYLFDMGNTVLDFHNGIHSDEEKDDIGISYMIDYLKTISINITKDKLKSEFLLSWYDDFYIRKSKLIELDVFTYLKKALPNLTIDKYEKLISLFYKPYKDEIVVNESIEDLFKVLKKNNRKIGIVSNCILPEKLYVEIFKSVGLDKYIDEYIFSYTYKIRKPNLKLFKIALDKLNGKAENTMMIGDGLYPDIYGAGQLDIDSIWYNQKVISSENIRSNHKNMILEISSFSELALLLDESM